MEVAESPAPAPARRVAVPDTARAPSPPAEEPVAEPAAAALPPDSLVLPAGTRFDVVLRTPLHTAITRPGDRFAARIEEPVRSGDRIALPAGTLVEGRVARAISASESDTTALLALDFVSLTLPDGTRLPLEAGLAAPEAPTAPSDPRHPSVGGSAARGAVTGAILGAVITRSRRGTAVGAAIGAASGAIVASSRNREVIVPSGTVLPIVLGAPLAIPPD